MISGADYLHHELEGRVNQRAAKSVGAATVGYDAGDTQPSSGWR